MGGPPPSEPAIAAQEVAPLLAISIGHACEARRKRRSPRATANKSQWENPSTWRIGSQVANLRFLGIPAIVFASIMIGVHWKA
jgi:hypothetical protein